MTTTQVTQKPSRKGIFLPPLDRRAGDALGERDLHDRAPDERPADLQCASGALYRRRNPTFEDPVLPMRAARGADGAADRRDRNPRSSASTRRAVRALTRSTAIAWRAAFPHGSRSPATRTSPPAAAGTSSSPGFLLGSTPPRVAADPRGDRRRSPGDRRAHPRERRLAVDAHPQPPGARLGLRGRGRWRWPDDHDPRLRPEPPCQRRRDALDRRCAGRAGCPLARPDRARPVDRRAAARVLPQPYPPPQSVRAWRYAWPAPGERERARCVA